MKVFVGLSGGVDSSLAASELLNQGYQVVGVYMKNWSQDIGDYECPWRQDYLAAKELATFLKIEFLTFDFEKDYKQQVVDPMVAKYKSGLTPNPDIDCNQRIKFDLFFHTCRQAGADLIATGHYAQTKDGRLYRAVDGFKDQTYFLYPLKSEVLAKTLFPIGQLTKKVVRQKAQAAGLPTASRPESMGICFVGQVGLSAFLGQYADIKPGQIIDDQGQVVGQHKGAILYTRGQRHGLAVGGGLPYYVTGKDVAKNIVYVTRNLDSPLLWSRSLKLTDIHWINNRPKENQPYLVRLRHQGQLIQTTINDETLELASPVRAATPGQGAVIYDGHLVLGGGIIKEIN